MTEAPALWALVPAAGVGSRMGGGTPKQFLTLGGRTVLEHSLEALWTLRGLTGLVVVSNDATGTAMLAQRFAGRALIHAPGGEQRCHSVLNGLRALQDRAAADDWVLVHDAARPCLRTEDLDSLVNSVTRCADCAGGLLAVRASDTIKRAGADNRIDATLDRSALWHAQTPQMFRIGALERAIEAALADGFEVTDEASAMEHCGHRPLLVEGHADNIKITRPEDLPLAELYLKQQDRL